MARFFLPNHIEQELTQLFVRLPLAQGRAQVVFGDAEQASPQLSVRGQAQAVAMSAERLADRGNDADLAWSVGKTPTPGRFGSMGRHKRSQIEARLESVEDFMA